MVLDVVGFEPGISSKVMAGISIAGVAGALLLGFFVYAGIYRRKKVVQASLHPEALPDHDIQLGHGELFCLVKVLVM